MNGDQEDSRNFAGEKVDERFHQVVFEGNPEGTPLARNMNINVDGIPLIVKSFEIRGGPYINNGLIEATVVVEAGVLGLVAEGKIEGDKGEAIRILKELAEKGIVE